MAMQGIDVSNWQRDIDLSKVEADFVIIKATEGVSYVSPSCDKQYQQAKKAGRCLGVYHYANGGNVQAEAEHFLKNIKNYIGESILVLDWESENNPAFGKSDLVWCKNWCDYVYEKTGVKPIVYVQKSALSRLNGIGDYGFWVAQYADMNPTGYQDTPWNEGTYSCVIRQYSPSGKLSGYSGNLDLNKAYINKETWLKYAGATQNTETIEGETEVVETIKVSINGKEYNTARILKNGKNYIAISDLEQASFEIGYNADTKTPSITNATKELKIFVDDKETSVEAINIKGSNYVPIRSVAAATGAFDVKYTNDEVIIYKK